MTIDTVGKLISMLDVNSYEKRKKIEEGKEMGNCYKDAGCCVDFGSQGRLPGEGDNVRRLGGGGRGLGIGLFGKSIPSKRTARAVCGE